MASLNKVMIIGNLGSEPEMRFTPNGNPVTSFRVATSMTCCFWTFGMYMVASYPEFMRSTAWDSVQCFISYPYSSRLSSSW